MVTTHKVPKAFVLDHINRDLNDESIIIRSTKSHCYIEVTDEQRDALLSDAEFYSDASYVIGAMGIGYAGISSSARATVRALQA